MSFTLPRKLASSCIVLLLIVLAGNACAASPIQATIEAPSPTPASSTAAPTETTTPPPTQSRPTSTPPPRFSGEILRDEVTPLSYISDSCDYLAQRWNPDNSAPGTIVVPIMYHSIRPYGEEVTDPSAINRDYFDGTIRMALDLGFETITSQELADFLHHNAKIPNRSIILILDDRRPGTAEDYFLPVLEENDWTATLGWIIGDTDSRTGLWEWIERLSETGYFDIQSHGFNHVYITEEMPESQVREEIFASIPILQERFGNRPIAYIWPGGNYTALGVDLAQEAGFEIGFTIHSRGPIMFNWIPQGEKEAALNNPTMLLPRFWSPSALLNIPQSVEIGNSAIEFARQNYPAEAAWFAENCSAELPPLEAIFK